MRDFDQQKALLSEMKKRIPQNSKLVDMLMDILHMGKEAVYRRLRSEVPFSFQETAIIAKNMGISLDNLVGTEIQEKPFQIKFPDFVSPNDDDYYKFEDFSNFIDRLADSEQSEIGIVTNALPQDFFSGFPVLIKFNVFKWQYYNNNQTIPFSDLVIPDVVNNFFSHQFKKLKDIKTTSYVFDKHIFQRIVSDIEYFHNIQLINEEDIQEIKKDLLGILDYIETFTINGIFPETGNKVFFFITDLDIPMTFSFIDCGDIKYSLIKAFILTSVTSLDNDTFLKMCDWAQSYMRASTLITQTNERQRVIYFHEQRDIINRL